MTSVNALTFNQISKAIANTSYIRAEINFDSILEQQLVNAMVTQENNKQELTYNVILENADLTAQLSDTKATHSLLQEEATKFAQIVAFHQDKDKYAMSLLNGST
ncbi:hypothetical protein [Acinetobacter rongchengensis]|uniref:Uncharacterized protein n=1 Tax=Acinetobacter rongchengensis TaxID=2419601 RepID=A0A3A8F5K5_9GAMM|nr:hypothetical protein [Acinetobacter rongchengensis]RKG41026.1 hypothetical protein D7V20_01145 [Acinetobacter rongchengensis]